MIDGEKYIIYSRQSQYYFPSSSPIMHGKYETALKYENCSRDKTFTFPSLRLLIPVLLPPFAILFVFLAILIGVHSANAISVEGAIKDAPGPKIKDFHLKVDLVYNGLQFPSSMAFLGPNDILVLEKNEGLVERIVDGKLLPQPLLRVPVANVAERGLLGIAIARNQNGHTYVFLYYTKSGGGITGDDWSGTPPSCNCLYRYELVGDKLVNPKLLLSLPAGFGLHGGGKLLIGPDRNLYLGVGNLGGYRTLTQNFRNSTQAVGSAIYRISQDGKPVGTILGNTDPINKIYAYGIRNTFGMDFDPVSKKLWDTENGPTFGDEINLVEPGFNSGWEQIQGLWKPIGPSGDEVKGSLVGLHNIPNNLVDFGGKGKYGSPMLVWNYTVAPTALKFLNSSKLGKEYENDMFVGDANYGDLHRFKLSGNRTELLLHGLRDDTLEKPAEEYNFLFGINFGKGITDLQVGPDGYLYILSITNWDKQEVKSMVGGKIYVIKNR
jgi:glucose/arabinose dehydrogenase